MRDEDQARLKAWAEGRQPVSKKRSSRDKEPVSGEEKPSSEGVGASDRDEFLALFEEAGELEEHERAQNSPSSPPPKGPPTQPARESHPHRKGKAGRVRVASTASRSPPSPKTVGPMPKSPGTSIKVGSSGSVRTPRTERTSVSGPATPEPPRPQAGFLEDWHSIPAGLEEGEIQRSAAWEGLLIHSGGIEAEASFRIGIDCGTSGIRIATYDEVTDRIRLFDFGENHAGGTRFSFPAVIGVVSGRIAFGNEAVEVPTAQRINSFKAGLIHVDHESRNRGRWRDWSEEASKQFAGGCGPGPEGFCYAIAVARALEIALPRLLLSSDEEPPPAFVTVAVGAPGRRGSSLHRRLEHAAFAGLELAGSLGSKPLLDPSLKAFVTAWKRAQVKADEGEGEKRLRIVPEVYSTIRSLEAGFANNENLLVADIGSTTTEMAVLRVNQGRVHLWHGESFSVGVDHRGEMKAGQGDLVRRRRSRVAVGTEAGGAGEREWPGFVQIRNLLRANAIRTLYHGWKMNPDAPSWRQLNVFVVGGGSNIPPLREAIQRRTPDWPRAIKEVLVRGPHPPEVEVLGASESKPSRQELPELVAVLGIVRPEWGDDEFSDDTVEPVIPTSENIQREIEQGRKKQKGWV